VIGPVRTIVVLAAAGALLAPAASASAPPYSAKSGPYRANPLFAVAYDGAGTWRTDFHATPPNPGGDPDTNDAHDSSAQSWHIAFDRDLDVADPQSLDGAKGRTLVVGHVDHTHVDGLYTELDRTVSCTLKGSTGAGTALVASLAVQQSGAAHRVVLTAHNPLTTVLTNMPTVCPDQGDSIDRILDNYFTPGFSFAPPYGPDPWFTSRSVALPARVLHHSTRITIAVRPSAAGRPPLDCDVPNPSYEQCSSHGSWTGTLTLRRRAP
jgi:hypothetical protein